MTWMSLHSHRSGLWPRSAQGERAERMAQRPPAGDHPELAQDLRLAHELQQGLLLQAAPRLPHWEVSAVSLPASAIGGDLYDFPYLPNNWHGLMIGDVSGHGMAAALRMAVARTLFRQIVKNVAEPGDVLAALNRELLREMPHGMVTMIYGHMEVSTGTLRFANAGHNFPVVIGKDIREIELTGLPLGIDPDAEYPTMTTHIAPGETILFYTDGIVEASDARDRLYSYARLQSLLQRHPYLRARTMMGAILNDIKSWSGNNLDDDVTMVVLRRRHAELEAELRLTCNDVLGETTTAQLWKSLACGVDGDWNSAVPQIGTYVTERFSRGLSRELQSQLRSALEDFRSVSQHEQAILAGR